MKNFFQQRWPWFALGMACLPLVSFVASLFEPLSPKAAMPYTNFREESTTHFRGMADYSYKLRSQATKEEFLQFVRKMKMEGNRVSDVLYEEKSADGTFQVTISYADDCITYEEGRM
jgi:hypothetical protein